MKALLVLELPNNWKIEDTETLSIRLGNVREKQETSYNNLPLKPLPQKKEIQYPTTDGITTVLDNEYTMNDYLFDKGYNKCIDELLGNKE